ncbi:flagellar assembly protein FliH [Salipaludibacillus sp. LMS25]|uniref:flagellar assembly protein FliH n=1 Tax=Salipaludibacillus sp. LMS25 TaxID=2924031 RepID=UPI0020D1473B|nr:flagellar assembly protein FliH [Salipaludibacillus sp. LMS25]UTR15100.1 flagellar assembly protein FliH [Salipaludibacillus sp. LMS25]
MSRLIKSASTHASKVEGKTIQLREVKVPMKEKPLNLTETAFSGDINDSEVHDNEQHGLEQKKHDVMQREEELINAKAEWEAYIKQEEAAFEEKKRIQFSQAEDEGFTKGYEAGVQEGQKSIQKDVQEAKHIVQLAKHDYEQKLDEASGEILELAMKVAEKIVSQTLETTSNAWISLVKEAITEVREQEEVKLYVAPAWYETTLSHKKELEGIALHTRELLIFPDDSLPTNGCVIETPFGQLEASADSQLREIKRLLSENLKKGDQHEH